MSPESAESVGLSSSRLQLLDRHLQQRYLDTGRLPCAMTLIQRRGTLAHFSLQGQMDLERARPLQQDTLFRIYSMTKPITSVALMMLVEQGLIALDDPVHRYIPQWRNLGVYEGGLVGTFRSRPLAKPMRIVDLLRHTSGLTYGLQQRTNVDAAYRKFGFGDPAGNSTLEGMIEGLAQIPLEAAPGDVWNYSVSTDVLGYIVGKVSGQPFEEFLRQHIFAPLGMVDTDFHVPAEKADRFAACYILGPDGRMKLQDDPRASNYLRPPSFISGGGGLVSTAADYLRFCRMLLNGGVLDDVRLLSPKTIELMTVNHLPGGKELPDMSVSLFSEASYSGVGFGLGFAVTTHPARGLIPGSAGDYSWGGMASTYFWIDPREQLIVIFMTQLIPSTIYNLRRELRTLVYSAFT
ncbi:serine hydrolase domain-containing protein [Steroidobacter sp.]|uniref:serine hydrolase domain-containing protein n=1 Tax=Steroidobacter sp. TaxID=1978227 RepID=UPI001A4AEEA5|nr:serine hydrolase domain-containing protein [Steroidobacter sp.]MBL8267119.1 beta-lactamase family protein [Steroidobacter sp.]